MPDYEECPFCDLVIEVSPKNVPKSLIGELRHPSMLEDHIRRHHHKVLVRKGSNYRWEDAAEMERRAGVTTTPSHRPVR
jgi:hypothetical protein